MTLSIPSNLSYPTIAKTANNWQGLIETYRSYLPVSPATPVISLLEGNTPLIPVPAIASQIGRGVKVYAKYDELDKLNSRNVPLPPQVRFDGFKSTKNVIGVHDCVNRSIDDGKHWWRATRR